MKRDFDCIRAVLLGLEALGDENARLWSKDVEGFDAETATYNIALLIDAGLIEGTCSKPLQGPRVCVAIRMTWAGHEFLDAIRAQPIWNQIKAVAREKGLSLTFDVVKAIAGQVVAAMLR